jgi:hypothetical protein
MEREKFIFGVEVAKEAAMSFDPMFSVSYDTISYETGRWLVPGLERPAPECGTCTTGPWRVLRRSYPETCDLIERVCHVCSRCPHNGRSSAVKGVKSGSC